MNEQDIVLFKWQPELLEALLDIGANVYLVLDRYDKFNETTSETLSARCQKVYRISSFDSLEELAAVAVDLRFRGSPVEQVISQNELSQYGARYLELLLGITRDPLRDVAHRDKRLMKQLVRTAGVPTARFVSVSDPNDRTAISAVERDLGVPVIVKPAAGYGTVSTVRVDAARELASVISGFAFDPIVRSHQLIVEEFVVGTELAIDAIWAGGHALTFVAHRYHEPRLNMNVSTSLDGSLILPPEDHPEIYDRLRAMNERVNDALGIRDGATHMEVFIRPDGEIVFSEVATRIGGAWIPGMLSAYLGHSVWSLLAKAALFGTCPPPKPARQYVGAVHVRPVKPGVISTFPTDAELAAYPGLISWRKLRKVGDRARLSHPSDYYLHIVLGADSAEELDALCLRAADRFAIGTAS